MQITCYNLLFKNVNICRHIAKNKEKSVKTLTANEINLISFICMKFNDIFSVWIPENEQLMSSW